MRRQKPRPTVTIGSRVEARADHEPFATTYGPQYKAGEHATVIGIRDAGAIELRFDDGRVPVGEKRRIAFNRTDFLLLPQTELDRLAIEAAGRAA